MIDLVCQSRGQLEGLCRKYRVRTLELIGSAARGAWDPTTSDLDFLVEFLPLPEGQAFNSYFGLREELMSLFQHPVDLVMTRAISNPYFLQAINGSRQVVYAA